MSLNKLTALGNEHTHNWMHLRTNNLEANNVNFSGEMKVKSKDGVGYNDFSVQNMGSANSILSTDGNGNLIWVDIATIDPSPTDISVYDKIQNIDLQQTTTNQTQINGTTILDVVTANSLTLDGSDVIDSLADLQLKTNNITYSSGINTTTISDTLSNNGLIHASQNVQVDGALKINCLSNDLLNYKLPSVGTLNQVLTSNGDGTMEFKDASGGSGGGSSSTDFSGLQGSTIKTNLNSNTTQPAYGSIEKYTALGSISAGQPVIYDYTNGNIKVTAIGSLPSQHEIAGICLSSVINGQTADILTKGLVSARRTTTYNASSETIALNNTTNGTTRALTNNTTFTDSGGSSNYTNGENYSITFDAGPGYNVNCTINSFAFEHTTGAMYDRLGIQTSNDGVNYTNVSVQWLQTSTSSNPPYSSSFQGGSWNSTGANNGYILPQNEPRALLLGGVPNNTFPALLSLNARYVRFYFLSDGSSTDAGWNITLQPSIPYSSPVINVGEGTTLYLDNNDYTKVSTDNTSQIVLGYCAYNDASDDSLLIRI